MKRLSKNTQNWILVLFSLFIGWFLHDRYRNRVSIHDRKRNLSNFCQSIVYYDNQRKMDRLKNLQQARKKQFYQYGNDTKNREYAQNLLQHPQTNRISW